jgi:hypothetical protein
MHWINKLILASLAALIVIIIVGKMKKPDAVAEEPRTDVVQYNGNNGTVSGTAFCQGAWGNPSGTNKDLKCLIGQTIADPRGADYTNTLVECESLMSKEAGGLGHWGYSCYK